MSIDIGIIGLPQSGKTTIFNALTGGSAEVKGHAAGQPAHVAIVKVPEPRLGVLAGMFNPRKVVPIETKYIDVGASGRGVSKDKGFSGELLNQLSAVESLIAVVRAFEAPAVIHPDGSLDVRRDIAALNLELAFSDLAIIERRLERLEGQLKAAKPGERAALIREQELLHEFQAALEKETPVRAMTLDAAAQKIVANFQFLTAKPVVFVVNIGEGQLDKAAALELELNDALGSDTSGVVVVCGKLEMELAQMEPAEAAEFRAGYGLAGSGLDRAVQRSYELSGMISFFTVGEDEVRAWSIKAGTTAIKAAGKIHTDMEKGFIRADFDDLAACGGLAEAKKRGLLRLEGKDYVVRDGDVITFLFNV